MNRLLFLCLLVLSSTTLFGQKENNYIYSFLNLPASARVTGLGGQLLTIQDNDLSLAYHNPASLNPLHHKALSFNYDFRFNGIQNGYFGYGAHFKKKNINLHASLIYSRYGEFKLSDEFGNQQGTFRGDDYGLVIGLSKNLNERFSIGANTKVIYSVLESYMSLGIAFDLGAIYQVPEKRLSFAFVAKNVGFQLINYASENEKLPIDLQFAVSKQLKHLPLRYSFIFHHLHVWDLTYPQPPSSSDPLNNNEPSEFSKFTDNLFRHVIINGEFLFGKKENFKVQIGYNHQLKKELSVPTLRSLTGFSGGFEFKIKQFAVGYGFAIHHLEGSVKHLSLRTNLDWFKGKRI